MQMIKYVALTGGIGCGKSVVSRLFTSLLVPVYDSDSRAKRLMETNPVIISSLRQLFGDEVYKDGALQKKFLADKIFNDAALCKKVNSIVHPQVWLDFKAWSEKQEAPVTIMETALLYESDLYKQFDFVIAVVADEEVKIQRVMERDGCSREDVRRRMEKQLSVKIAEQKADFVIKNNDTFVIPQVIDVLTKIKGK